MARLVHNRDISPVLATAKTWINSCLIGDASIFGARALWTKDLISEVGHAFVDNPDFGDADFITKLMGQLKSTSPAAQKLAAELLWALLLFPSNVKPSTKRLQIMKTWALSGERLDEKQPNLQDTVLAGIGSGGTGFNNYRPLELEYLIGLVAELKQKPQEERGLIFSDYDAFVDWIDRVPSNGRRQFRHMIRYFSFPDKVERMSSNNDRASILDAFDVEKKRVTRHWTDSQFDEALHDLRTKIEIDKPGEIIDFYMPALKYRWRDEHQI